MVRPPHETDATNEPFAPHPYVIVAAPTHPLSHKRNIKFSQLANEAFAMELSSRTDDFREGIAAFREKRAPRFEGK